MSSDSYSRRPYPAQGHGDPRRRAGHGAARPAAYRPRPAPATQAGRYQAERDYETERLYESFNDLYEDFDEGRSKTPFVIIGALLAVAIVGGGLALAYRSGGSDTASGPAVIRADETAAKVEPENPGGLEIPHQDRQIFDQVAGQPGTPEESEPQLQASEPPPVAEPEATAAAEEDPAPFTIGALASRATQEPTVAPVAQQPAAPAGESTLPAGDSATLPEAASPQETVGEAATNVFQPRRVRTVSISPDGRVIAQPSPDAAPASPVVDTGPGSTTLAPVPAEPTSAQETGGVVLPSGVSAEVPTGAPSVARGVSTLDPLQQPATGAEQQQTQTSLFTPSPRPKPRPTTQGLPQQAAVQPTATARPEITPPPSTAATQNQGAVLEGFAVQVASHRRQADAVAKFADLQQRFPNLISGYQPLIQRADLGDRGIFFRLRIGPITSRAEANRLCSSLQSAGLPGCFVRAL